MNFGRRARSVSLFGAVILGLVLPTSGFSTRYLVGYKSNVSSTDLTNIVRAGGKIHRNLAFVKAVCVEISDPKALSRLQRSSNVAYVEEDLKRFQASLTNSQMTGSLFSGLWGLYRIHALEAHLAGFTGAGVRVGVADTGVDYTHPDIAPNYAGGYDAIDQDSDPTWGLDPAESHCTHVCGTIVGADDSQGVLGVAPGASLYVARVLGPAGGTSSDIMEGVRWLAENAHCQVINLSIQGFGYSKTEQNFYANMRKQGVVICAAAGNYGQFGYHFSMFPGGYTPNIGIAALDRFNNRAYFSNMGGNVLVSAPGVAVVSSVPTGTGKEGSIEVGGEVYSGYPVENIDEEGELTGDLSGNTTAAGVTGTLMDCGDGLPGDFPLGITGNIALVKYNGGYGGSIVGNAADAGAAGVVIYNNEDEEFQDMLTNAGSASCPAIMVSGNAGAQLLTQVGNSANFVCQLNTGFDTYDGTSMATPHVTGAVALMLEKEPTLTPPQIVSLLESTATDLGPAGFDPYFGYGLINVMSALDAITLGPPPPPSTDPELFVTVGTSRAVTRFKKGITIYVNVRDLTKGVPRADVDVTIETPLGNIYNASGITNAKGIKTVRFVPKAIDGYGTYKITATATKADYQDDDGTFYFSVL